MDSTGSEFAALMGEHLTPLLTNYELALKQSIQGQKALEDKLNEILEEVRIVQKLSPDLNYEGEPISHKFHKIETLKKRLLNCNRILSTVSERVRYLQQALQEAESEA